MANVKKSGRSALQLSAAFWILAVVCLAVCGSLVLMTEWGIAKEQTVWIRPLLYLGEFFLLLAGAMTSILIVVYLFRIQSDTLSMVNDLRKILSGQTQSEALLTHIGENLLLSDAIKSVAFREKDRMVLEAAIQQDIRMEQWESAERLIGELAGKFGGAQQAAELRQEMLRYRSANMQEKIDSTIKHIESLWLIHQYEEAEREVDALIRLYRNNEQVKSLVGKTAQKREEYKRELLDKWDKAIQNNDVDQGVELLKRLDAYLTPTEAAALEESARGVFRARLHNMGVQFSLFVTERKWSKALDVGKQIVDEYPNSRMAQEVREKIGVLEQRAGEEQPR